MELSPNSVLSTLLLAVAVIALSLFNESSALPMPEESLQTSSDSHLMQSPLRKWSNGVGLWGKRSIGTYEIPLDQVRYVEKRPEDSWNKLNSLWGKRSASSWQAANGLWGKRSLG